MFIYKKLNGQQRVRANRETRINVLGTVGPFT